MNTRGLLSNLTLTVVSLLLVLGLAELVLRMTAPVESEWVDTAVEGDVTTRGKPPDFRGAGPPGDKQPGVFRVVVVGDSFSWGAGVHPEDSYPRRLERRLAELSSDRRLEVVNWSRPGWNTYQAWLAAERGLAALDPDLLVLGFTLNDAEPGGTEAREELYRPLERRRPVSGVSGALLRHSALSRLIWQRLENRRQRRAFTSYYRDLFTGPYWDQCRESLAEFRRLADELSIPLLLLVFPVFDQPLDDSYTYQEQHRIVAAAAGELGVPVLDLLDTFRGIDTRRLAVTPFTDPHPNELAHRIASDRLAIYLVRAQLVPAELPEGVVPTAVKRRGTEG